jgi:hypothetical protein
MYSLFAAKFCDPHYLANLTQSSLDKSLYVAKGVFYYLQIFTSLLL